MRILELTLVSRSHSGDSWNSDLVGDEGLSQYWPALVIALDLKSWVYLLLARQMNLRPPAVDVYLIAIAWLGRRKRFSTDWTNYPRKTVFIRTNY